MNKKVVAKKLAKDDAVPQPYTMRIDRMIVNKLGLKLYDKVSAVVAELIANSYDADADLVQVKLPLGKALAVGTEDKGHVLEVIDNGHGMTPKEANIFYLRVGKERRDDPAQGNFSREKKRPVMGRKGIGKLAAFGICKVIEVRSAGGEKTDNGYLVTHFELNYDKIIDSKDKDNDYHPTPLSDDNKWDAQCGTVIRLKEFLPKKVSDRETFGRQLSARFAISSPDFTIRVIDTKEPPEPAFDVDEMSIELMEGTRVQVDDRPVKTEAGEELKVTGWVGMAKNSYRNEEMTGIRIYARNKFAGITRDFDQPSGFAGEFVARSYLVGELHAEWLDTKEDLIQTHRQNIIWESEYGEAFAKWGQELIKQVAKAGREPRRDKVRKQFLEVSNLRVRARERFNNDELEKEAFEIGEKIGGFASEEELTDASYVEGLTEIILTVAPHKLLVDAFKKIKDMAVDGKVDLRELVKLFETTRIAQLASYGQIVAEKISAIDTLELAIRNDATTERDLQTILEGAPWLIKHEWIPIIMNQTLSTFQKAFQAWYKKNKGAEIVTSTRIAAQTKRPDFVFLHVEHFLVIVEIKPPNHVFEDADWERLQKYYDATKEFMEVNPTFKKDFPEIKVILIRDKEKVNATVSKAMKSLKTDKELEVMTWEELLRNTKQANQNFLIARDEMMAHERKQ
jgi:hypothetical protein